MIRVLSGYHKGSARLHKRNQAHISCATFPSGVSAIAASLTTEHTNLSCRCVSQMLVASRVMDRACGNSCAGKKRCVSSAGAPRDPKPRTFHSPPILPKPPNPAEYWKVISHVRGVGFWGLGPRVSGLEACSVSCGWFASYGC